MLSNLNDEQMKRYVIKGHTSSIRAISLQLSGISLSLIVGMELCQEAGKLFFVNSSVDR
jgi:bisphosphoglycerate-dependent phosphoglycerate mutase